ncbi:hypothetical protein MCHI_002184, partial [Candidatus Magnetoovum chiemensis]
MGNYLNLKLDIRRLIILFFIFYIYNCCTSAVYCDELIDGVAAFVGNEAITISELDIEFNEKKEKYSDITKMEVINTMINRSLFLKEAKKLMITGKDDEDIINQFIDIKVRSFITIKGEEIEDYYNKNKNDFLNVTIEDARNLIERYLVEEQTNKRLKILVEALKKQSYIKINAYVIQ